MDPRISIGMPCFNSERWIAPAIESLLAQSLGDFELIVSDNASTDSTWEIVQRFAATDVRVRPHRNPRNLGAAANFNRVFELSSAPYFKWASSNDWCAPDFLRLCLEALETDTDAVLACTRAAMFTATPGDGPEYEHGLDLRDESPAARFVGSLAIRRNISMNGLIRSTALRRTELIRPYFGSDSVMISALSLQGKLLELPPLQLFMRDTPETSTARMTREVAMQHFGPSMAHRMNNQSLRNWLGYWRAVRDATLPTRERLVLIGCLMRMARWRSRLVVIEAVQSLQSVAISRSPGDATRADGGAPGTKQ